MSKPRVKYQREALRGRIVLHSETFEYQIQTAENLIEEWEPVSSHSVPRAEIERLFSQLSEHIQLKFYWTEGEDRFYCGDKVPEGCTEVSPDDISEENIRYCYIREFTQQTPTHLSSPTSAALYVSDKPQPPCSVNAPNVECTPPVAATPRPALPVVTDKQDLQSPPSLSARGIPLKSRRCLIPVLPGIDLAGRGPQTHPVGHLASPTSGLSVDPHIDSPQPFIQTGPVPHAEYTTSTLHALLVPEIDPPTADVSPHASDRTHETNAQPIDHVITAVAQPDQDIVLGTQSPEPLDGRFQQVPLPGTADQPQPLGLTQPLEFAAAEIPQNQHNQHNQVDLPPDNQALEPQLVVDAQANQHN